MTGRQPDIVASPTRDQLNREASTFPVPVPASDCKDRCKTFLCVHVSLDFIENE